jgi:hypothetical protein
MTRINPTYLAENMLHCLDISLIGNSLSCVRNSCLSYAKIHQNSGYPDTPRKPTASSRCCSHINTLMSSIVNILSLMLSYYFIKHHLMHTSSYTIRDQFQFFTDRSRHTTNTIMRIKGKAWLQYEDPALLVCMFTNIAVSAAMFNLCLTQAHTLLKTTTDTTQRATNCLVFALTNCLKENKQQSQISHSRSPNQSH